MAEEKITLTLNPQISEEETIAEPAPQLKTADQQQEVKLSPEEQKMVDDFSKQIDVTSQPYCSTALKPRRKLRISPILPCRMSERKISVKSVK